MYALTGITGQRDENRRHETNSADQQEIPETRHLRLSELKKRVSWEPLIENGCSMIGH